MKIQSVIVISILSLAVGYSLAIVQQRSGRPDSVAASATESSEEPSASVISDAEELETIEAEPDEASLLLEFTPAASKVLDPPFEGSIRVVWPKVDAKPERIRLNIMKPADGGKGHSPISTPYLATTEDGASYWGAFALRPKLPDTDKLTSFSSYEGMVELLGAPTHLPFSGETDDKWAHDSVSWRLFSPTDPDSLEVLEISVARKILLEGGRTDKYLIEWYSVSRGTLSKGDQAGAEQPAPASPKKPEDKQKPQAGSEPASR